jgi:hypothetical protein
MRALATAPLVTSLRTTSRFAVAVCASATFGCAAGTVPHGGSLEGGTTYEEMGDSGPKILGATTADGGATTTTTSGATGPGSTTTAPSSDPYSSGRSSSSSDTYNSDTYSSTDTYYTSTSYSGGGGSYSCPHSPCTTGSPLSRSCDENEDDLTYLVCSRTGGMGMESCCDTDWTASCAAAAMSICQSMTCHDPGC